MRQVRRSRRVINNDNYSTDSFRGDANTSESKKFMRAIESAHCTRKHTHSHSNESSPYRAHTYAPGRESIRYTRAACKSLRAPHKSSSSSSCHQCRFLYVQAKLSNWTDLNATGQRARLSDEDAVRIVVATSATAATTTTTAQVDLCNNHQLS